MTSEDSGLVDPEARATQRAPAGDASKHGNHHSKRRSSYFTLLEQRVLLEAYEEHAHIFNKKSNKAAAAKARENAWRNVAARVNACNSSGEKRTWIQLKMKYKNMLKKANRKPTETCKINGELLMPPLTEAEGLAICQSSPAPVSRGISRHSSPEPVTDGQVNIVKPEAHATGAETAVEDAPSVATKKEAEIPTERVPSHHQDGLPSASAAQLHTLPVNELYRHHLLKTIQKTDKELLYLDRQIRKADLEILLLERQLRE